MRFPQIFMLLVLFCAFIFSCRDTAPGKMETLPHQDNSIPSAEEHKKTKHDLKESAPIRLEHTRDSMSKKQKKSKDLDTLKPKIALLDM